MPFITDSFTTGRVVTGTLCIALACFIGSMTLTSAFQGPLQAQESEKRDPQPGLLGEDVDKQVHDQKEPLMMLRMHKKPKTLKKRWRFVDLDARKEVEIADYEKAIAEARKAEEEGRIEELTQRKIRRIRSYESLKFRVERAGDGESYMEVRVETATRDAKIADVQYGQALKGDKNWTIDQVIKSEDTTTKRDMKKNRFTYLYEAVATNNGKQSWFRFQTILTYARKGAKSSNRFKIITIQRMDANKVPWNKTKKPSDPEKETMQELDALLQNLIVK